MKRTMLLWLHYHPSIIGPVVVRGILAPGAFEKVASDLGEAVVFAGYSGFFHQLQLASHDLVTIWQKK